MPSASRQVPRPLRLFGMGAAKHHACPEADRTDAVYSADEAMPANLSQPYLEAEERYRAATTHEEKVAALEEMITLLPKHKGTEKLHADLKSRLAKLRKGDDKKGGPARRSSEVVIEKEGAGQVLLLGAPNAGKSSLMAALTNAPVEVTEYPFSTHRPVPGSMRYQDVRIQLVDLPSISPDFSDPNLPSLCRLADATVICADLSSPDCLDQPEWVMQTLSRLRIQVERTRVHDLPKVQQRKILPAFIAGTKADHPDAVDALALLREAVPSFDILPVSVRQPETLDAFRKRCFDLFGLVRVYSKPPGRDPEMDTPFLLPEGATVLDFAGKVHLDFREKLAFARVWGPGKYEGQRVARDYRVADGDVIELHMR